MLCQHDLPLAQIETPYTCLFLDTGQHRVMIDTGAGRLGEHAAGFFPSVDPRTTVTGDLMRLSAAMSRFSLRLPGSLHEKVRELAQEERISINQFITTALAEKISALITEEYLNERAERASREKFERASAGTRRGARGA